MSVVIAWLPNLLGVTVVTVVTVTPPRLQRLQRLVLGSQEVDPRLQTPGIQARVLR